MNKSSWIKEFSNYRRRSRRWVRVLVCAVVVGSWGSEVDAGQAPTEEEVQGLRAQIEELQQTLREWVGRRADAERLVREADAAVRAERRRLQEIERRMHASEARLADLQQATRQSDAERARRRAALAEQIRQGYRYRPDRLQLALRLDDPTRLARMLRYQQVLTAARRETLAALQEQMLRLQADAGAVQAEHARLQALRRERATRLEALARLKSEREEALARLRGRIETAEQKLARLKQDEQRLTRLLQELDRRGEFDLPPGRFAAMRGRLAWPVKGRVLARYGAWRARDTLRWQGVWIGAEAGAPVRAVAPGRVAYADWLRGFGLLVILDHGDGYMTLYGYNQGLYVGRGERVQAGATIAEVGDTGGQGRPGLYFELRHQARPVDPTRWFRGGLGTVRP